MFFPNNSNGNNEQLVFILDEEIAQCGIQGVVDLRVVGYCFQNFYFKTLYTLVTIWLLLQVFRLIIYKHERQSK
jgi:hypothetical protein